MTCNSVAFRTALVCQELRHEQELPEPRRAIFSVVVKEMFSDDLHQALCKITSSHHYTKDECIFLSVVEKIFTLIADLRQAPCKVM